MRVGSFVAGMAMVCGLPGCMLLPSFAAFEHRTALDAHDLVTAHEIANVMLDTPRGEAPRKRSSETSLWLLDRGGLRWAQGNFEGCRQDLGLADKWLEYGAMKRARFLEAAARSPFGSEKTRRLFWSDYERGWDRWSSIRLYERLSINSVNALCHLELGDHRGACVEARRFGVLASWASRIAPKSALGVHGFGELVSSLACYEQDRTRACKSLERSGPLAELVSDSALSRRCRSEEPMGSELWVLVGYGRPSRPYPMNNGYYQGPLHLVRGPESVLEAPEVVVDDRSFPAVEILDMERAAFDDRTDRNGRPPIIVGPIPAARADYFPEAWETLPAHVHLAVVPVAPGVQAIEVRVRGQSRRRSVKVGAESTRLVTFYVPW